MINSENLLLRYFNLCFVNHDDKQSGTREIRNYFWCKQHPNLCVLVNSLMIVNSGNLKQPVL